MRPQCGPNHPGYRTSAPPASTIQPYTWWTTRMGRGLGGKDCKTTPATTNTTPVRQLLAPLTPKQHQQDHRPRWPTEHSDPTQHTKGRTSDCPGPCEETTTRRNVTQGANLLLPGRMHCTSKGMTGRSSMRTGPTADPHTERPGHCQGQALLSLRRRLLVGLVAWPVAGPVGIVGWAPHAPCERGPCYPLRGLT